MELISVDEQSLRAIINEHQLWWLTTEVDEYENNKNACWKLCQQMTMMLDVIDN